MMLVQWREGQKGKNVQLTLSTALKELGLMAWHLNLPSPDVPSCLISPLIQLRCLPATGQALICSHSCGFGVSFSLNALGEQLKTQFLLHSR